MKDIIFLLLISTVLLISSCSPKEEASQESAVPENYENIKAHLESYSHTKISADISHLSDREKELIKKLTEVGHLADKIFWRQSCPDAVAVRDSLAALNDEVSQTYYKYVKVNFGPYDKLDEYNRFVGEGPARRPEVGGFYPVDLTKEEFEKYIADHPEQKDELESQYTIVVRDGDKLKTIPYHEAYPEQLEMAKLLDEAAELADEPTFKNYLKLRAKALRNDDYFESDMAWMDIKNSNIDFIIGPIENYEDALFNYKAAHEAVIMVKDVEATKQFEQFKSLIPEFQKNLPVDKKYIPTGGVKSDGSQINLVNVLYFGGDCQKGTKTIAASLPNDPKVREAKGGKNSMYLNMMTAKFEKIVVPIANALLDPSIANLVDSRCFLSFVTLHEVSHTLGREYVLGNEKLAIRKALQERYTPLEETKADILSMYNHFFLRDKKLYDDDYIKRAMATYVAGLYRSIRFGGESAHGKANLIQLNFLRSKGAIVKLPNGKFNFDENLFFEKVKELANLILTVQADGSYEKAGEILSQYAVMSDELKAEIDLLKDIPRDLDTEYEY
ncbi:MAG: Zn-dependent hydrolase [Ignavibacteria bacterium]|nr:Zn-dependent hydrolase [Ignavibacteria bacterium]